MIFPILIFKKESELKEFVKFWKKFYSYPLEDYYSKRINKKLFTRDDIVKLFTWKNGMKLSSKKQIALERVIKKIGKINHLKKNMNLEEFKIEFNNISSIWKIFLLHIINPYKYPIFDQHVFRAFHYINHLEIKELPWSNTNKEKIYFEQYLPFFYSLNKNDINSKEIDEALWSFGKFLKTNYARHISL